MSGYDFCDSGYRLDGLIHPVQRNRGTLLIVAVPCHRLPTDTRALFILKDGPTSASIVGARLWPDRTSRGSAVHGGGDYAAQMLLGRMRKLGWTRVVHGEGSSQWALTGEGLAELTRRKDAAEQGS